MKILLNISYQLDANLEPITFTSTYPNMRGITPVIFSTGHENELAAEAPFIATAIWKDIDKEIEHRKVLRNSVACDMEFANGQKISLTPNIINAKHNTEVLNS